MFWVFYLEFIVGATKPGKSTASQKTEDTKGTLFPSTFCFFAFFCNFAFSPILHEDIWYRCSNRSLLLVLFATVLIILVVWMFGLVRLGSVREVPPSVPLRRPALLIGARASSSLALSWKIEFDRSSSAPTFYSLCAHFTINARHVQQQ